MRLVRSAICTSGEPVSVSWRRCSAMMPALALSICSDMRVGVSVWEVGLGPGSVERRAGARGIVEQSSSASEQGPPRTLPG